MDDVLKRLAAVPAAIVIFGVLYSIFYNAAFFYYLDWDLFSLLRLSDFLSSAMVDGFAYWTSLSAFILVGALWTTGAQYFQFLFERAPKKNAPVFPTLHQQQAEDAVPENRDTLWSRIGNFVLFVFLLAAALGTGAEVFEKTKTDIVDSDSVEIVFLVSGLFFFATMALAAAMMVIKGSSAIEASERVHFLSLLFGLAFFLLVYTYPLVHGVQIAARLAATAGNDSTCMSEPTGQLPGRCVIRVLDNGTLLFDNEANAVLYLQKDLGKTIAYPRPDAYPKKWDDLGKPTEHAAPPEVVAPQA